MCWHGLRVVLALPGLSDPGPLPMRCYDVSAMSCHARASHSATPEIRYFPTSMGEGEARNMRP